MDLFELIRLPYAVLGLIVGVLVGMTGVGGGSLTTPLLILLFGAPPMVAVGTDLLFAGVTKSVGTVVHGLNHTVEWRITALLAAGSLPAAAVTLFLVSKSGPHDPGMDEAIRVALAIALLVTALSLPFRQHLAALAQVRFHPLARRRRLILTVVTGVVVGVLVSLTSVGAGAVGIVVLMLLYPEIATARLVAADIAHAVPLTLLAGFGHWLMGSTDWPMLGSLLLGSIPGIVVGSYAATRVPERALRAVLAAVLVVVAYKTVF